MDKPPTPLACTKRPRTVRLSVVLAGCAALLLPACGGSPTSAGVAHLGTTTTTNASSPAATSSPAVTSATGGASGPSAGAAPSGGSGSGSQSGFSIAGGNEADALAFAECMRSHGVPSFPDPNSQGVIQGSGLNPNSPSFQSASNACRHFMPNGGKPTPAQQAKAMAQALKFSQCMRSHGIRDFPDPKSGPGGAIGISIRGGPGSDLNPNNPEFEAAQKACQGIMGGAFGAKAP